MRIQAQVAAITIGSRLYRVAQGCTSITKAELMPTGHYRRIPWPSRSKRKRNRTRKHSFRLILHQTHYNRNRGSPNRIFRSRQHPKKQMDAQAERMRYAGWRPIRFRHPRDSPSMYRIVRATIIWKALSIITVSSCPRYRRPLMTRSRSRVWFIIWGMTAVRLWGLN